MIESVKAIKSAVSRFVPVRRKERRRGSRSEHLRGRCVVVEFVGGVQTVPIVDSHHGGLAIANSTPLLVGSLVTFRGWRSKTFAKIQGSADVVYCRCYGERRFLIGLQFTQVRFASLLAEAADLNPTFPTQTL